MTKNQTIIYKHTKDQEIGDGTTGVVAGASAAPARHVYVYIYAHICMCVYIYIYIYICICTYMRVLDMHIYIYIYVCMHDDYCHYIYIYMRRHYRRGGRGLGRPQPGPDAPGRCSPFESCSFEFAQSPEGLGLSFQMELFEDCPRLISFKQPLTEVAAPICLPGSHSFRGTTFSCDFPPLKVQGIRLFGDVSDQCFFCWVIPPFRGLRLPLGSKTQAAPRLARSAQRN